jgi:hypothetical protein
MVYLLFSRYMKLNKLVTDINKDNSFKIDDFGFLKFYSVAVWLKEVEFTSIERIHSFKCGCFPTLLSIIM